MKVCNEKEIGRTKKQGSETQDICYHKREDVPVLRTFGVIGDGGFYKDLAALPLG